GDTLSRVRAGSPYATLPPVIQQKSQTDADPLDVIVPPRGQSEYYQFVLPYELLKEGNYIVENVSTRGDTVIEQSVLDTLYEITGPTLPYPNENPHNVVMTYYHGPAHTPFVFTGFNLWNYKRAQIVALADFVLQKLWNLSKTTAPHARASGVA